MKAWLIIIEPISLTVLCSKAGVDIAIPQNAVFNYHSASILWHDTWIHKKVFAFFNLVAGVTLSKFRSKVVPTSEKFAVVGETYYGR